MPGNPFRGGTWSRNHTDARASRRATSLAVALLFTAFAFGPAFAETGAATRPSDPDLRDIRHRIEALQSKVRQLEARQAATDDPSLAANPREIDAAIRAVRRDAARRSPLLDVEGFTAGYANGKFLVQSADGAFVLNPNLWLQFRGVADARRGAKNATKDGAASDDVQTGFELRRMKFAFDGNAFSRDLVYKFQWSANRKSGVPELEEAYARYHFPETPWAVRAGQYPDVWAHEAGISAKRQLAVERSLLNEILVTGGVGGDVYVQGVSLVYDDDGPWRGELVLHDGFNSRNTPFADGGGAPVVGLAPVDFGTSLRVERKFAGDWKQYDDFTALHNTRDLLVLGGGLEYTQGDGADGLFHTLDAHWEPRAVPGLTVYAAYVALYRHFRNANANANGSDEAAYDWGVVAQAGYLLDERWEVFARYDYTHLDDAAPGAPGAAGTLGAAARVRDEVHEITVGANYYLHDHAAKFTLDAVWLPHGSPVDANGSGVLPQRNDKDQYLLRGQFQLLL